MQHRHDQTATSRAREPVRPTPADAGRLVEIARAIAHAAPLWRRLVCHDRAQRGFVRLYTTPAVEAWLLTWSEAQAIELHDHGGSSGAVIVVEGELIESFTDLVTRAPLRHVRWPTASTHFFDANHVHDLHNHGPQPATSIHVYSPPLSTMTFYTHRRSDFLQPLRLERVGAHGSTSHS